jgi:hypothetical protein
MMRRVDKAIARAKAAGADDDVRALEFLGDRCDGVCEDYGGAVEAAETAVLDARGARAKAEAAGELALLTHAVTILEGPRPAAKKVSTEKKVRHEEEERRTVDDDDDDDEDEPEEASRGRRKGEAAAILSMTRAMGLEGSAADDFILAALRDQVGARPTLASASATRLPHVAITMGPDEMGQPQPRRAAVAHRAPSPDAPPPPLVSVTGWRDVPPWDPR